MVDLWNGQSAYTGAHCQPRGDPAASREKCAHPHFTAFLTGYLDALLHCTLAAVFNHRNLGERRGPCCMVVARARLVGGFLVAVDHRFARCAGAAVCVGRLG